MSDARHRRTKLVGTIGPASLPHIRELVGAGMDVARINLAHGSADDQRDAVHAVRGAAHAARRSVAVMIDLPGAKIRLGELAGGQAELADGQPFELRPTASTDPGPAGGGTELGSAEPTAAATVDRATLAAELQAGDTVLLADGLVELRVTGNAAGAIQAEVVHGGVIRSRSGVAVPPERRPVEPMPDADREAVARALELRPDLIAQSFVASADDVRQLRAMLPGDGPRLVAKIETQAAVSDFEAICEVADGIMVARGDLGLAVPYAQLPVLQKDLLRRAAEADRFSIVATQMLESMVAAPRPTRAEATDVANAVLDGADALMLSAETAIGRYPVEALGAMRDICAAVEARADFEVEADEQAGGDALSLPNDGPHSIVLAAVAIAPHAHADAIWCFTRSGRTAELLSMARPQIPILAFTPSPVVARRLAVRRSVVPLVMPAAATGGTLLERMRAASHNQHSAPGLQTIVLVTTSDDPGGINRLEIVELA